MVDYTKPLDDARLEAAAHILSAWSYGETSPDANIRNLVTCCSSDAFLMLTEARRQTGADEMAAALRELILAGCPCGHVDAEHCEYPEKADCPFSSARAALAAYERIAK